MKILRLVVVVLLCSALCIDFGFVGQVKAQDEIGPLLATDVVIAGDNAPGSSAGDPFDWTADIEFDGRQYLAVWTGLGNEGRAINSNIYGRFITTSGLFNGDFFPIAADDSFIQEDAAVAFNGVNYLVVWEDRFENGNIKGQLITPSGVFLGGVIDIAPQDHMTTPEGVDVSSDGTRFLVVWTRDEGSSASGEYVVDTYGQFIAGNGTLNGSPFKIGESSLADRDPSIFFGAGKYLVAWERGSDYLSVESRHIYGTLIDASTGDQTQPFPIATGESLQGTSFMFGGPVGLSFDGTNFILVWSGSRDTIQGVYAARISQDGQLLDGPPDTGGVLLCPGTNQTPHVVFDGKTWLVAWNQDRQAILGVRVSSDGYIIDQVPVLLNAVEYPYYSYYWAVFLACDGTNCLVTWCNNNEQLLQFVGSGIPTASTDGPFLVSVGESIEMDGSASFSPDGKALTYYWDFGDNSPSMDTEVVTHTYTSIGNYTVTLVVNDGINDSNPFVTTATVVGSTGGGQQQNVDNFLAFMSPPEKTTQLPIGTQTYDISVAYGLSIDPGSLNATLNGVPLDSFNPVPGTIETVTIPLAEGRNILLFMIDGIRPDGRVATDRDRLTFVVK